MHWTMNSIYLHPSKRIFSFAFYWTWLHFPALSWNCFKKTLVTEERWRSTNSTGAPTFSAVQYCCSLDAAPKRSCSQKLFARSYGRISYFKSVKPETNLARLLLLSFACSAVDAHLLTHQCYPSRTVLQTWLMLEE